MMRDFDPRVTPARADLAAKFLEGKVPAPRYVEGRVYEVIDPQAPLRQRRGHDAPLDTEALKGERVTIYDENEEGWAWGQLAADNYVGWLPLGALAPPGAPPTHKVAALRTFAFPGPSIKLPPVEAFPFGAKLAVARVEDRLAVTDSGFYVPAVHLQPVRRQRSRFRRGGRALSRRALSVGRQDRARPRLFGPGADRACGLRRLLSARHRYAGAGAGNGRRRFESSAFKRGDLIFWKGHVAIVRDAANLLHANAFHMAVAIEPIAEAVARIRAAGSEVTSVRQFGKIF